MTAAQALRPPSRTLLLLEGRAVQELGVIALAGGVPRQRPRTLVEGQRERGRAYRLARLVRVTTRTATRAGRVGSSSDRNSRAAPACRQ